MPVKLIAMDMDETFLRTDKTYDRERFKQIFKSLMERGIIFLVASGGSYHQLREKFDKEELDSIYFGADNGSFIVKKDEVLHSLGMPQTLYLDILDYIKKYKKTHPYISTGMASYIIKDDPTYKMAKLYNKALYEIDDFSHIPADKLAYKIAIHHDVPLEENKRMADDINQQFPEVYTVTTGNNYVDATHKEATKGHVVEFLQNKYNILPSETLAFGDSMNDLTMLNQAYYSIAMSNADPELIKHSKYTIGNNNDQAALDILEQFIKESSLDFLSSFKND